MTESRLQRWARKKAETRQNPQPSPEAPVAEPTVAPDPADQELATNEQLTEQELLAKYNLPNPDALEQGTDITGFLRKEIPEFLRRKALRSLWRSNPVFSVLDGLNEYDEDFSKAKTFPGGVKTAYKVGQGFLDPEKRKRERLLAEQEEPTDDTVRVTDPDTALGTDVEADGQTELNESQVEETATGSDEQDTFVRVAEVDEPGPPRYRPRMQFNVE